MKNERRLRAILALLLVATAALFAVGTTIERSQRSHTESAETKSAEAPTETATTSSSETGTGTSSEANGEADAEQSENGETTTSPSSEADSGAGEAASGATETAASSEAHAESSERLFGVDPESVPAMIAAIAVSLGLAAAVWWRRERAWLWLTLAFGAVFAAGDIREVIHQLGESRNTVATIAAILIAAHLAVAVVAGLILRQPYGRETRAPSIEPST